MTFTEAAAQVLRLVGKPLHYKEITDVAIEKNLLSHVGKSPEVTMGARLAAVVKKEDDASPLVRVKPGVFALREWDQNTIDKGLSDRTPAMDYIARRESHGESEAEEETHFVSSPVAAAHEASPREDLPPDAAELQRAEMAAHAREFFDIEEDDDEPILSQEEELEEPPSSDLDDGNRRRRRRRRRGKGLDADDDLPSYTVSDAPANLDLDELKLDARGARSSRDEDYNERDNRRERGEGREGRGRDRKERDSSRESTRERDREAQRSDREAQRSDREAQRSDREAQRSDRDWERGERPRKAGDEPELVIGLQQIIGQLDRRGGFVALKQVAEQAMRRYQLGQDVAQATSVVHASIRADNLRQEAKFQRRRFRLAGQRVALVDGAIDSDLRRLEEEVQGKVQRYQEQVRRQLLRRLQDLPQRALAELIILVFERLGYTQVSALRRPGSYEIHLSAKAPDYAGATPTAIVVRKDGKEVGRERVTELRGSLHHYGPAAQGFLVTTGQVLSGAREEAQVAGAAPIALLDGNGLAALCEQYGIGVTHSQVQLATLDFELFDALKGQ